MRTEDNKAQEREQENAGRLQERCSQTFARYRYVE
jgi:hypothetical protein